MNKKLVASLLTAILLVQTTAYAATTTVPETSDAAAVTNEESKQSADSPLAQADKEDNRPVLTLQEAIEKGLKNSLLFQEVQNKADIAKLVKDNSYNVQNDLNNAASDLDDAHYLIDDGRDKIYEAAEQLDSAQSALDAEEFPQDITYGALVKMLPEGQTKAQLEYAIKMGLYKADAVAIPKNTPIKAVSSEYGIPKSEIIKAIQAQIDSNSDTLDANKKKLESSTDEYLTGQAEYQAALKYALSSVSSKLSTSTISSLDGEALGSLIVKMCTKQDEVTSYAVNIYKNQIALLIENSYFEALKQQELLAVKEKAEERGRVQYEMAEAAYEVGAKSKDEMIIAKTYYDSTIMNTELQRKDYNTALIELKKNMNMSYKEDFKLEVVDADTSETFNLDKGIESGLRARLEIKMAKASKDLYGYLMTAVNDSAYSSTSNQHKEVELLQKQADIAYQSQQATVESDIRTSYQAMESTKKLVEKAKELREGAEATVEMAKAKYEVGYGYSNSLLASLHLEQMSGTTVEVIAAEENLANIEEKEIEAKNGYNLARLKYLNDIGVLPY